MACLLSAREWAAAGFGRRLSRMDGRGFPQTIHRRRTGGAQQGLPLLQHDRIGRYIGEHERSRADDGIRDGRRRAEHAGAGQDGCIVAEHRLHRAQKDAEIRAEFARFAVAAGGVLGYECDLSALSNEERTAIRDQIVFYKQYREVMQFGAYYPLGDVRGEWAGYCTVSPDKSLAVAAVAVLKKRTGVFNLRASFKGLEEDALYRVSVREGAGTREVGKATGGMLVNGSVRLDGIFDEQDARSANPVFTRMFVFEKI